MFFSKKLTPPLCDHKQKLAKTIAHLISEKLRTNCSEKPPIKDVYTSILVPAISIEEYLIRFMQYFKPDDDCLYISLLIYLDIFFEEHPSHPVSEWNIHRLMICCISLASKFHFDQYPNNQLVAKLGGISAKELYRLEIMFCKDLDYKFFITEEKYMQCEQAIMKTAAILCRSSDDEKIVSPLLA